MLVTQHNTKIIHLIVTYDTNIQRSNINLHNNYNENKTGSMKKEG